MTRISIAVNILFAPAALCAQTFVETSAYRWHGDTITQGAFTATAPNAHEIISDYAAQPGYKMPVDKSWHLKNDINAYPQLSTPNTLHEAIYNMGLDEMVNAVEPDTTLRTGKEWPGVWTRDVSYSILLSMAYMQPEASRISLMKKVDAEGRIVQDTGSGGAWPVSTDRMIWAVAAYELYKVTGDRQWLEYIYPIIKRSLEADRLAVTGPSGLIKGETSFIDWREQSHPRWMQTADIYNTETLSTSVVHAQAWKVLSLIADELGHKDVAAEAEAESTRIAEAVNRELWMTDKGYYAMYRYGRDNLIVNPRAETLGEALAVMWDVAPAERAQSVTENSPVTAFGAPVFFPQIADIPAYHNNALWPWVAAWWGLANAKAGNEQGVMQSIGSVFRPAALFATNKENLNLDNGDIATELNSSNMLWCLAGNIALTHKVLFGIDFQTDGLHFKPFVPEALGQTRTLSGFRYRDAILNITVEGFGDKIESFAVNGIKQRHAVIPADAKGTYDIRIVMDNKPIAPLKVNLTPNIKAPLTPTAWFDGDVLTWNPIEYIDHYVVLRDGHRIDTVFTTTYPITVPGEYQIIGVNADGTESFASEPRSNRHRTVVEIPDEATVMKSPEILNYPERPIAGYTGNGFVEVDHNTPAISIPVQVDHTGNYAITLRYANGNGPIFTKNSCAVRTLTVDGTKAGTMVMPQRGDGNWSDWGNSNSLKVHLTAGRHIIGIEFRPEDENMNLQTNHALIDHLSFTKLAE